MDIAIALVPSVLFGAMGILVMLLGGDSRQQTLGEMIGGFAIAVATLPFIGAALPSKLFLVSLASGILLGLGIQFQIKSFHILGVSRTMPISTAAQLIGMAVLGIILFGEWQNNGALPVGLLGLSLVVIGVVLTNWTERRPNQQSDQGAIEGVVVAPAPTIVPPEVPATLTPEVPAKLDWKKGFLVLAISTCGLVGYLILLRSFEINPLDAFFPQAIGFLLTGFIFTFPFFTPELGKKDTRWSKYTLRQTLTGAIWGVAVVIMQYSTAKVGVATGFTLSQLGVIISTIGGIVILKEKRTSKEMRFIMLGIALLVVGAVLIGVAKGLDAQN